MKMKTTQVFTSTISPEVIDWVNAYAKKVKRTRREVLEEALLRYKKEVKQKQMRDGFKRAALDSGTLEFAEWGMDDYSDIVK